MEILGHREVSTNHLMWVIRSNGAKGLTMLVLCQTISSCLGAIVQVHSATLFLLFCRAQTVISIRTSTDTTVHFTYFII